MATDEYKTKDYGTDEPCYNLGASNATSKELGDPHNPPPPPDGFVNKGGEVHEQGSGTLEPTKPRMREESGRPTPSSGFGSKR